jgi:molybdopterin synthase sulfur carrier subunit
MTVTVRFIGALRNASGKGKITMAIKNAVTLRDIIKKIVEEEPKLRRALIDPELEDPRPNALILVNEKEISVLNGLETMLKDGDEVVFVPVLHGG